MTFGKGQEMTLTFNRHISVTRHAKMDLLGSNVVTSEMTFKASQVLMSFSSHYFSSRWLSSIGLYPNVTKLFGVKRTRPKTLVAKRINSFVFFLNFRNFQIAKTTTIN